MIVEFSIPTGEFALPPMLTELPVRVFQINRVVAHDTDHLMPFVWVSHGEFETVTNVLEDDPTVADVERLTTLDERLYRMEWTGSSHILGSMVVEQNATVQRATAHTDQWDLRVLFPDRERISATHQYAQDNDYCLDINRICDLSEIRKARFDHTEGQHEVPTEAVDPAISTPHGRSLETNLPTNSASLTRQHRSAYAVPQRTRRERRLLGYQRLHLLRQVNSCERPRSG